MAYIVHKSVSVRTPARCSISLWCLPSLFFSSQMEKQQNVRPPLGTTEWNHSYYTGSSLSALHSLQQLQGGAAPSSSVSCPQVTLRAAHPQVQTGPTRTITSDLLSAALAEAATQLYFAALLERCISVNASPPLPLPVPTRPLDAATQTFPRIALSRDVSAQLSFKEFLAPPSTRDVLCPACARPVPSLLLDAAVQTPLHSVATHDASTQLPLTEFFTGCILSNDPLDRQALPSAHCNTGSASLPQPADIATTCSPSSSSHASDGHVHATAPHVLLQPLPGLEKYAHLCASHGMPVEASPVRPRLCTAISVTPPQPHGSTTHVGTHPVRSATTYKRSASTAQAGTHNPVGADLRAGTGPFPNPPALVLFMVKFGQFKPDGLGHIDTADSDFMHHQYRLSVLQWNPGPARRKPTNIIAAACGEFHAVILQEPSDHVPHISDQFIAYTGNTDLAILLNKDTFEPDPMVVAFMEELHKQRYLGHGPTHRSSTASTPFTFWNTDGYILLCTHPQCRGQET